MHIGIVGAGAVGSLLGACLAVAGHAVTVVDRGGTRAGDLDLVAPDGRRRAIRFATVPSVTALPDDVDAILVAVKQYDLREVVAALAAHPETPLVTVQNGVGAEALVVAARPGSPLVAASLTAATELETPTEVRWLRRGGIGLAPVTGQVAGLIATLAGAFAAAGLPPSVLADAAAMKWSKLLANLVANATSALLDLDPARVYADGRTFPIERRQLLEAEAVMRALGLRPVALPGAHVTLLLRGIHLPEPIARPVLARAIGGARGGKSPSLRLHLRGGGRGPTEIRWLNGAVAAEGARLGVPAPVNALLARLVDEAAAEPERAAWWHGRPDRLRDAVAAADAVGEDVAGGRPAAPRDPGRDEPAG